MAEQLLHLLTADFMPHGYCFLWLPEILWLHVAADALIAASYYSIPAALLVFIWKCRTVPFRWMFLMFSAFILACGTTHLVAIWTIWNPTYGIEGLFKLFTGILSFTTAVLLVPLIPKALALRSPAELEALNHTLEVEIARREQLEAQLRDAQRKLQLRVEERTAELAAANARLVDEVRERKHAERRVLHLAYRDALTGLPNRVLLQDRLHQALAQARRESCRVALMLLDLDDFKQVNDTFGHPTGDALLRAVARRLRRLLRGSDTIARLGGDEFAVLQPRIGDDEGAMVLARKIAGAFSRPFDLAGREFHVSTSIGISLFPSDGETPERLIGHADMALYRAKDRGRGKYQFFAPQPLQVAVNVSPAEFKEQDFPQQIAQVLEETGLDPHMLSLEMAESLLMGNEWLEQSLERLTDSGARFSIDDFGTGFSSLAYLRRLPIEEIKIDRTFVDGIGISPDAEAIVRAMIQLGHSLGKRVTAEGVETPAQRDFLRAQGCDEAQGFLIGAPMPADDLAPLLRAPDPVSGGA